MTYLVYANFSGLNGFTSMNKVRYDPLYKMKILVGCQAPSIKKEMKFIRQFQRIIVKLSVCRTRCYLTIDEVNSTSEKAKQKEFDDDIKHIHGDCIYIPEAPPEE